MAVVEPSERALALDDSESTFAVLLVHDLTQVAGLVHVRRRVGERNGPHLAVARQAGAELELLDGGDIALRLRDQLLLAQPARRLGRCDEPLRVLRSHVPVDAEPDRLGAELRDRVARVDSLRAALVAEVAARAVPDAVLLVVALEALDRGAVPRIADETHPLCQR